MCDDDNPDYICPACNWQGDEDECITCFCGRILCKKCGDEVTLYDEYIKEEAERIHDEELEEDWKSKG